MGQQEKTEEGLRTLKDGSLVEGFAPGGKVLIVRTTPEFVRDILPYFLNSIFVFICVVILITTNRFYLPFFVMFFISPTVNYLGTGDIKNLSKKSEQAFEKDKRFDIPLQFFVFFEIGVYIWSLIVMSDKVNPTGFWFDIQKPQTYSDYFGFALIISFFTAVNIPAGHELFHHKETHNKVIGTLPAVTLMYSQVIDEHLKGHHKTVSTLDDPATSRKNESVYAFVPRSIYGSLTNVWGYESKKIEKYYGKDANVFIRFFCNKMVWYEFLHGSILYAIYHFLGWESLKFNFLYIVLGLIWLETVNYIEHYGILRKKDENGVDESIGKMHSWNSLSGAFIVRLQRHSDHHAHSFRPYQILRRMDDAPFMPFEYLHNYFFSFIPPLWFYIMNPKVEALDDIKEGRVNKQKTAWNNMMALTEDDKKRERVGMFALLINQAVLAYLSFY